MLVKPALTPSFCLHVVVNSTPSPGSFHFGVDDPSTVTLFDLGITDPNKSAVFVQNVKSRIFPWHINDSSVKSGRDSTLQGSADSIPAGAFD